MTKEEAIRILASSCIPGSKQTEALETLIPELKESEDKRMVREFNDWLCEEIECLQNDLRDEEDRKTLNMLCYVLTKVKDWLEKQKEVGIQWLKSDNVKNPDKPYIDKAGMFYTTDGRMCYASEIEKQKEHQELPLMNGDADLYFDTWRQEVPVPTFRQCFEEGMRYAQRLQKEQKPVDYEAELKKCKDNPLYFYDKYVKIKLKSAEWSEEDETHRAFILESLEDHIRFCKKDAEGAHFAKQIRTAQNWLKSLRPQPKRDCKDCAMFLNGKCTKPHWKPSDEQMKALNALNCHGALSYVGQQNQLISLYNDLKKLM